MEKNNTGNVEIKIKSEGIEKLISSLKGISGAEKGVKNLVEIIGTFSAAQKIVNQLLSMGFERDAKKLADICNNLSASISNLKIPEIPTFTMREAPAKPQKEKVWQDIYDKQYAKSIALRPTMPQYAKEVARNEADKLVDSELKKQTKKWEREMTKHVRRLQADERDFNHQMSIFNNYIEKIIGKIEFFNKHAQKTGNYGVELLAKKAEVKGKYEAKKEEVDRENAARFLEEAEQRRKEQEQKYYEQAKALEDEFKRKKIKDIGSLKISDKEASVGDVYNKNLNEQLVSRKKLIALRKEEAEQSLKELMASKDDVEFNKLKLDYQQKLSNLRVANVYLEQTKKEIALEKEKQKEEKRAEARRQADSKQRQKDNKEMIAHLIKEKQLRDAIKNAGNISASITGASSKITGKELEFRIKEINAELKKMPANIRKVQSEKIAKDLDTAGVKTRIINGQLIVTATHSKKIESHFTKTVKEMFSMEKLLSRISFVITAKLSYELFDILQRIPRQALQVWRDFQDELSKTFAQMAGESRRTKDKMTADIIDLSKKYGIAAKELSTAMYEIVSSQVPIKDAAMVLEQSIKLSLAGAGDIASATKTLVQIANAYNMEFKEVARISDIAFQSVKYGQLTMQQYTEQMSKVVATASILKVPIEEVSAAVSTMTINGINAEQAFTALNQMLMTIANPTERSKNLMKELGINLSISDVQTMGLGGALSKLVPILNMTGSANEELLTIMFKNRTGFKAVASILQNMPEYYANYARMINSAGVAEEGLAERTNTVAFQQNRLKTSFESLLMLFSGKNNNTIVGFFKSLAGIVSWTANNMNILATIVKIVVTQLLIASSHKIIAGIGGIANAWTAVRLKAIDAGQAIQAMGGWVLFIANIIGNALWTALKRISNIRLDKMLGISEAKKQVAELENQVKLLDSKIGSLNGIKKMVSDWEALNGVQNKNIEQKKALETMYESIKSIMHDSGIQIDSTKTKAEQMAQAIVDINNQLRKLASDSFTLTAALEASKISLEMKDFQKKIAPRLTKISTAEEIVLNERTKIMLGKWNSLFDEFKKSSISGNIDDMRQKSARYSKYIEDDIARLQKMSKEKTFIYEDNESKISLPTSEKWSNSLNEIIDMLIRSKIMFNNARTTIPEVDEIVKTQVDTENLGGKEPSKTSFLGEATSMFESLLGDTFYETYEELQAAMLKKLKEIRDKIAKAQEAGQVVTELKETEKILDDSLSLISSDSFIQMITEAQKSIGKISDNAKSLRKSGNIAASESELRRAGNIYNSYLKMITELSGKTAEQLMTENPSLTSTDAKTLVDNVSNAGAELMFFYLSQIKDAMSDEAFILEAIKQLNLSPELLTDYDALMEAIKAAEDSGQTEQLGVLKLISDTMMAEFSKMMDDLFGITSEPEFIKVLVAKVKEAVAQSGITDKDALYGITIQAIEQARESGYTISAEQAQRIINEIIPSEKEKESAGFDVKGLLGIKDYGSGNKDITSQELTNAAYMDMAQQTVQTLQNTWSFYWEWEINKLKEQQEKKLELLENEKKTMLANDNISQEQRAVVEARFAERQKVMQEKFDKEMAAKKKKQAMVEASIAFAKGLIGIWAIELGTKGFVGALTAPILTAMLSGLFAVQMAMIANQKYAGGGYTGSGVGEPDETGYKPAGIVHEGELVIDKKTMDRNFVPMMSLYDNMRSGRSFDQAIQNYLMNGSKHVSVAPNRGLFAGGGYVGKPSVNNSPMVVRIDLGGARVIDNVELHRMVELGGKKRRVIGG